MEVDAEVTKFLQKEAVRKVTPCQGQFVSRLFTVPKKDGSCRPVVNLRPLNQWVVKQRFKMESILMLRDLIREGDWMVSIDLKDAFLSIPIHAPHRKLLRFAWRDNLYEFQSLPFGLSSAPRTFTKVLRPVMAVLRRQGIRSIVYIDDLLLLSDSRQELMEVLQEVILLLRHLGFRINWEKSQLVPLQKIPYLGFMVDSLTTIISLPDKKLQGIKQECSRARKQRSLSIRTLARIIGRLSAAAQAILPAPLYYRALQQLKNTAFRTASSFDDQVPLTTDARRELQWWMEEARKYNGRQIHSSSPDLTIESDASLLGWGALAEDIPTGGLWSPQERCLHINVLELMAGAFAVKAFSKARKNFHIRLKMDNTSAVAYLNHMGGTRSPTLSAQAQDLWQWCLARGITLSAEHLAGTSNEVADYQSRSLQSTSSEWRLDPTVFMEISRRLGPCEIDLFASHLNAQTHKFISWRPDPFAMATDALQTQWTTLQGYAFPPFCLVGRCLGKVRREQATIALVAPVWTGQPWYPALLELLVDYPILLPSSPSLLRDPFEQSHPLLGSRSLQLAAWRVSGKVSLQVAFQRALHGSSRPLGAKGQYLHTNQPGQDGIAGVCKGRSIPFQLL